MWNNWVNRSLHLISSHRLSVVGLRAWVSYDGHSINQLWARSGVRWWWIIPNIEEWKKHSKRNRIGKFINLNFIMKIYFPFLLITQSQLNFLLSSKWTFLPPSAAAFIHREQQQFRLIFHYSSESVGYRLRHWSSRCSGKSVRDQRRN